MKKFLKYGLISISGIIVVGAVGIISLITFVNPNRFKPLLEKSVYEATGRQLTLAGDISWKLYPNLGITLRDASLSNPIGYATPNLVTIHSADVSVALIPLLSNHIVVKTLALDGLQLGLIQKNNLNNWTFTPPPSPATPSSGSNEAPKPLQLEMKSFSLTNSDIHYDNWDSKQHIALDKTKFIIDTDFGGVVKFDQASDQIDLSKVNFNYDDLASGKLDFSVQKLADPSYAGNIEFSVLKLNQILDQIKIANAQRKDMQLLNNISLKGYIKGDSKNLDVKDFSFNFSDKFKGKTSFALKNFTNPNYNGSLDLEPFNLNQVLDSLNVAVKERKDKPLLNNFSVQTNSFSGDKNNINFNGLKIAFGSTLSAMMSKLSIANFTNPSISGDIAIPKSNLNKFLDGLNISTAERKNKPLLNEFSLNSGFNISSSSINLSKTKFSFGNILNGSSNTLQVQNFANPQFKGDLNLANFSINTVTQQLGLPAIQIANKQILDNFNINTTFAGNSNSLNLSNLRFKLGNSTVNGSLNLSSFKPLAFTENLTIDQLDVANFSAVNGYHVPIKQLRLNGSAKIASDMNLATLNAKQNISAENISVQGISLDKLVLQFNDAINRTGQGNNVLAIVLNSGQVIDSINKMKAQVAAATKPGNRDLSQVTNLGSLNANATINNGTASPSNLKLVGPSVSLIANGWVNLAGNKNLNYHATSQLLVNGINPIFKKLIFPSTITGTINSPSAELDWMSIQQQILRYAVEQNKGQIQNAVKQQINQAVGQQVNQALGNQGGSQAVDAVSKGVTHAIGQLFGGQ